MSDTYIPDDDRREEVPLLYPMLNEPDFVEDDDPEFDLGVGD